MKHLEFRPFPREVEAAGGFSLKKPRPRPNALFAFHLLLAKSSAARASCESFEHIIATTSPRYVIFEIEFRFAIARHLQLLLLCILQLFLCRE